MQETKFRFKNGQRVKLKNDRADVYPKTFGGQEGIVDGMEVRDTFAMIYVKWDRKDWRYHGEDDMWTFEDHFDPVEEIEMSEPDLDPELLEKIAKVVAEHRAETGSGDRNDETYEEAINEAADHLKDCEAFLVIGVSRLERPEGDSYLESDFFKHYKTEEAGLILEAQVGHYIAHRHEALAIQAAQRAMRGRRGRSS